MTAIRMFLAGLVAAVAAGAGAVPVPPDAGLVLLGRWANGAVYGEVGVSLSTDRRYAHTTTAGEHFIVDVSAPDSPVLVGAYPLPQEGTGHHLDGATLFVATGNAVNGDSGRVHVVSVGSPSDPARLAEIHTGGLVSDLATHAGHLYVLVNAVGAGHPATPELRVFSLLEEGGPASPVLVETVALGDWGPTATLNSLAIISGHAYVGVTPEDGFLEQKLAIFNLFSPAAPARLPDSAAGFPVSSFFHGIHRVVQAGAKAYAAVAGSAVAALDVSDPAAPVVLGTWHGEHSFRNTQLGNPPHAPVLAVDGDVVYVTVENGSGDWIHVLDASDPAAMKEVNRYRTAGLVGGLAVGGNDKLYVTSGESLTAYSPAAAVAGGADACDALLCPHGASCKTNEAGAAPTCVRPPAPVPNPVKLTPQGCYEYGEFRGRALKVWMYSGIDNTVDGCAARCWERNFKYAGVEDGRHCFCGVGLLWDVTEVPSEECGVPCTGGGAVLCGGASRRMNVYRLTGAPESVGCFRTKTGSTLRQVYSDAENTVERCTTACAGFRYAGLVAGSQCLCGNELPTGRALNSKCWTRCTGDAHVLCGGATRATVYATDGSLWRRTPVYKEKGCFAGKHVKMELAYTDRKTMTVGDCAVVCAYGGHTRAGLTAGTTCWCGGVDAVLKKKHSNKCNERCAGGDSLVCGGDETFSIYSIRS